MTTVKKNYQQQALTVKQAAAVLGSTETLIRRSIKEKMILSFKLGPRKTLIPVSEINKILKLSGIAPIVLMEQTDETGKGCGY